VGGAAQTSLILFNKSANDQTLNTVYSSLPQFNELAPSRILYDGAHWQSEVSVCKSLIQTNRYEHDVRLHRPDGTPYDTTYIVAPAWSHRDAFALVKGTEIRSPNYSKLPPQMRPRSDATDPLPPTRGLNQRNSFYFSSFPCEYVSDANSIIENVNLDPDPAREISVLDTLYMGTGGALKTNPKPAPEMTYYHGNTAHQFVFSGFTPWAYARQDCMALVDFVLQDLWGLTRQPIDRGSFAPALRNGGSTPVRVVTPAQRSLSSRVKRGTTPE